jgi:hypothetical protein
VRSSETSTAAMCRSSQHLKHQVDKHSHLLHEKYLGPVWKEDLTRSKPRRFSNGQTTFRRPRQVHFGRTCRLRNDIALLPASQDLTFGTDVFYSTNKLLLGLIPSKRLTRKN